jgi:DNA-binding CsgD family transcriptional regulator
MMVCYTLNSADELHVFRIDSICNVCLDWESQNIIDLCERAAARNRWVDCSDLPAIVWQDAREHPAIPIRQIVYSQVRHLRESYARRLRREKRFMRDSKSGNRRNGKSIIPARIFDKSSPSYAEIIARLNDLRLSARDRQIVFLRIGGMTFREIGDKLQISHQTVSNILENVTNRLTSEG